MQTVCLVARFQVDPRETHVKVVKRILRYLESTLNYGLWYKKGDEFSLSAFVDADWAGSVDDRRNTGDGDFFLGDILV